MYVGFGSRNNKEKIAQGSRFAPLVNSETNNDDTLTQKANGAAIKKNIEPKIVRSGMETVACRIRL